MDGPYRKIQVIKREKSARRFWGISITRVKFKHKALLLSSYFLVDTCFFSSESKRSWVLGSLTN